LSLYREPWQSEAADDAAALAATEGAPPAVCPFCEGPWTAEYWEDGCCAACVAQDAADAIADLAELPLLAGSLR
jgi:hypothetical protein